MIRPGRVVLMSMWVIDWMFVGEFVFVIVCILIGWWIVLRIEYGGCQYMIPEVVSS